MEQLALLQAQWQEDDHIKAERELRTQMIAMDGLNAALRYERQLANRRTERRNNLMCALCFVIVIVGCCLV